MLLLLLSGVFLKHLPWFKGFEDNDRTCEVQGVRTNGYSFSRDGLSP
jgi:hypothetical protein